ncbi:MAG: ATP-binding protein [Pseudomonadales bacterium]
MTEIDKKSADRIYTSITTLRLLTLYRLMVLGLLVLMHMVVLDEPLLGSQTPNLFRFTALGYFVPMFVLMAYSLRTTQDIPVDRLLATFLLDIVVVYLLRASSGEMGSSLFLILILDVAVASTLLPTRLAALNAALATLAILTYTLTTILYEGADVSELPDAATLGIALFASFLVINQLALRARRSEALADQQAGNIASLQHLTSLVLDRMNTGIIVTDANDDIEIINAAACELLEAPHLMADTSQIHPLPATILQRLQHWRDAQYARQRPLRTSISGPELRVNFAPLVGNDSHQILIFIEDSRALEQEAQHMKLDSLGRLTGSIAHEIRNPLGAISHAAQLLYESKKLSGSDLRLAEIIQDQSQRLNSIVENVLILSRRNTPQVKEVDITAFIENLLSRLHLAEYANPQIEFHAPATKLISQFDPNQLEQVLQNLIANGLRYSKRATDLEFVEIRLHQNSSNQLACVDVIDIGKGIAEENRNKIFEPFFTTEKTGTGLGLYISHEICETNQIELYYLTTDSGKTCFRLIFPHQNKTHIREPE